MLILILVFTLSAAACNKEKTIAGTPGPDDEKTIVVCGLTEQDFEITLGELKNLPVVTRNVESAMSNGEKISARATGPLLDTFLKSYGKNQQDFSHVRFTAKDCYSIAVPADILANREILLSYLDEGQFLADEMGAGACCCSRGAGYVLGAEYDPHGFRNGWGGETAQQAGVFRNGS
ncbi:MAG: hypothetical protein RQM92_10770 [Candidatus Syntrophopropionicum ammoniitolerans]